MTDRKLYPQIRSVPIWMKKVINSVEKLREQKKVSEAIKWIEEQGLILFIDKSILRDKTQRKYALTSIVTSISGPPGRWKMLEPRDVIIGGQGYQNMC